MDHPAPPLPVQNVIRLSLIGGATVFTGIAFFIRQDTGGAEMIQPLLYGFGALFLIASAFLLLLLKPKRDNTTNPQQRFVVNLVGWAASEAVALFGAVVLLMGGPIYPAVIGITLMSVMLFVYFPPAE